VEAVLAANPRTIVVLQSGSPYELPWADKAPAIVEGWLDGEQAPLALARVLLGDTSPSGKLPVTFPRRLADNPTQPYYPAGMEASYGEGVLVGYRWYERKQIEPLFPFGHGLSYTSFEYSDLRLPARMTPGAPLAVSLQVRNSGSRPGMETVQLYVGNAAATEVVRPVKELKAFEKVQLAPGEARTVRFTLSPADLAYYDATQRRWVSTPGTYHVLVGSSSRDIRLKQDFQWATSKE
jgi:beta-glucosidase